MEDGAVQDERLVQAVLDGQPEAFAELVRRYQKLVGSVVWRYGARREEVEDVVSEVFYKLYRNLHLYRPDHPFATWLYRLAVNHVLDHGRRARRERVREALPADLPDGAPGPATGMEQDERAALLRSAMAALAARYREPLFLVYVEGLKLQDAALVLGLPLGTVKTRLLRGRRALHEILTRRHPEHFGGTRALS